LIGWHAYPDIAHIGVALQETGTTNKGGKGEGRAYKGEGEGEGEGEG
jgi:hypothetical protein